MDDSGQDVRDLWDRFEAVAREHPHRVAVVADGSEVGFGALARRVEDLAGEMIRGGAGRGSVVAVCLPRCPDLVAAMLAAWRIGAAYLPLEPDDPADRLTWMLHDAGASLIVSRGRLTGVAVPAPTLDVSAPIAPATAATAVAVSPDELAYVIYTSGSTGRPKGVQVRRGAVAALVTGLERAGAYAPRHRRVAGNASVTFDASVQQWARVCRGDTVFLVPAEIRVDPAAFAAFLDRHEVSDVDLTPTHLALLGDHLTDRSAPLRLFVGGEPMTRRWWTRLADSPHLEAVNLYGPTECTVDATMALVAGAEPHIGRPLPGVVAYVLDEKLRPVEIDATGELYLGGAGLARGYAGRAGLTAASFVADPFTGGGARMYRTGDLVRRNPDETYAFAGRADRQVKVRGFRIEPGEIEAVLLAHPAVSAAHVLVADRPAGPALVAYYTARPGATDAGDLRGHLEQRLPEHMVPAVLQPVAAFPLTRSGKIDRAALPEPAAEPAEPATGEPVGPVETALAQVWQEVLAVPRVTRDDNFFALGGHSLGALRVAALIRKRLPVRLVTRTIYRFPVMRDLAAELERTLAVPDGG